MRKSFKLNDLECANCAAKMEQAIKGIEGVRSATISFMTSKLVLDADENCFETILDKAQRICTKIEPDCIIVQ